MTHLMRPPRVTRHPVTHPVRHRTLECVQWSLSRGVDSTFPAVPLGPRAPLPLPARPLSQSRGQQLNGRRCVHILHCGTWGCGPAVKNLVQCVVHGRSMGHALKIEYRKKNATAVTSGQFFAIQNHCRWKHTCTCSGLWLCQTCLFKMIRLIEGLHWGGVRKHIRLNVLKQVWSDVKPV